MKPHFYYLINGVLQSYVLSIPVDSEVPVGTVRFICEAGWDLNGKYQVMKKRTGNPKRKSWAPAKAKHRQLMKTHLLIEGVSP